MKIQQVTVIGVTGTMGANIAGIFASFGNAKVYCLGRDIEKVKKTIPRTIQSVRADAIATNLIPADFSRLEQCVSDSDLIFESLKTRQSAEGEEFFYNLLWDKTYTILDYIDQNTLTIFYDYDRQLHAEEAIRREFSGMYRKTRENFPVLPPDMMLLDFKSYIEKVSSCLLFRTLETEETSDSLIKIE